MATTSEPEPPSFSGSITQTNLVSSIDGMDASHEASIDFITELPTQVGLWTIYVEGNTTPHNNGVSAKVEGSNADSGSAFNAQDEGRLQVSGLHLTSPFSNGAFQLGLMDLTSTFDNSTVANDETSQFLSSELINNAAIPFPDYTLGGAIKYEQPKDRSLAFHAAIGHSNGLSDNPNKSYSELFDIFSREKGIFAITELAWNSAVITRVGIWHRSSVYYNENTNEHQVSGLYSSIDSTQSQWAWNIRLGTSLNNRENSLQFFSVAIDHPLGNGKLGLGSSITHQKQNSTILSHQLFESYYQHLFGSIQGSFSLQWRNQDNIGALWIAGLRFNFVY